MHSQETELQCLGKKDIIMVNGGSNDLDNNIEKRSSILSQMLQFAQKYTI
jgi:hypothetical protein